MDLLAAFFALGLAAVGLGFECHEGGRTHQVGESWVGEGGCKACICTDPRDSGMRCTDIRCGSKGEAGSALCHYGYVFHGVGIRWTVKDQCNHCTCLHSGHMTCTNQPCKNSGFDQPKEHGGGFMDCNYKGRWYNWGDHFLADDGCNTCACRMPGNYATFPICTSMPCDHVVG